jgi:hypothetical protein
MSKGENHAAWSIFGLGTLERDYGDCVCKIQKIDFFNILKKKSIIEL